MRNPPSMTGGGLRRSRLIRPTSSTSASPLHVQHFLVGEFRALLDEFEAAFRLVAHETLDRDVGFLALVIQHDAAQERALAWVHGGLLELDGQHLAQSLEAADLDLGVGVEFSSDQLVPVRVVARVENLAAM